MTQPEQPHVRTTPPDRTGKPRGDLSYVPEFDGFRGIGITFVVLFHLSVLMPGPDFWGAWLMVDMFFVISGYLITTLLLRELDTRGRVILRNFYVRRALRLLPALFIALIGCGLIVYLTGFDRLPRPYPDIALIVLTYFGNWFPSNALGPFTPAWSLALEEQYYLIWPILLLFLLRTKVFSNRRVLAWTLIAGAVGVAMLRYAVYEFTTLDHLAYHSTATRSDGVILGSALALLLPTLTQRWKGLLAHPLVAWVSSAGLGIAYLTLQNGEPVLFKGPLFLVNVLGTLLVAYLVERRSGWLNRTLSWPVFTFTGRLSYAMYLYHTPLIVLFAGSGVIALYGNGMVNAALVLVATFGIGAASYLFVEQPALKLKRRFGTMSHLTRTDTVEAATHPEVHVADEASPTAQTSGSDGTS
jgi:peptidoglycan/LPS O-acetylase OafA/YrhL